MGPYCSSLSSSFLLCVDIPALSVVCVFVTDFMHPFSWFYCVFPSSTCMMMSVCLSSLFDPHSPCAVSWESARCKSSSCSSSASASSSSSSSSSSSRSSSSSSFSAEIIVVVCWT